MEKPRLHSRRQGFSPPGPLYMLALVACRFNKDGRALYRKLVEAGKPAKVAITAVVRKLVVLANALLRNDRPWAENARSA